MNQPTRFAISDVTWTYEESLEIRPDGSRQRHRVGVSSAALQCLGCGHSWRAYQGSRPGQLGRGGLGPVISITCPACAVVGEVSLNDAT